MKTAFIIGAGASTDFDLPTGPALQQQICDFVRPHDRFEDGINPEIMRVWPELERRGLRYNELFEFCDWFARTLPLANSIDAFMETQSKANDHISFLGKHAISSIIAAKERASKLYMKSSIKPDFTDFQNTWIGKLWAKTNKGGAARVPEKGLKDINFITFNYDRCIERFLYLAFKDFYRLDSNNAQSMTESVNVFHVYGSLGSIFHGDGLPFGHSEFCEQRLDSVSRIRTYSESSEANQMSQLQDLIEVERIIFIGFSFGAMNQNLLSEVKIPQKLRKVYGTAYGMSPSDVNRAQNWADSVFRRSNAGSQFQNVTGAQFFDENQLLF